ncbi:MAG: OmpA family protein [Thiovulaceae bacterium]|nr:OmpA family protein [Sulfurimonadaceae bacterium]
MRGKIILSTLLAAMFLISGCGGKEAVIDETAEKSEKKTDTESSAQAGVEAEESSMLTAEGEIKSIYFDFDVFTIRGDMQDSVEKNSEKLNSDDVKGYRIKIEGNCDEWGTDEYNYALGLKRATSTKKAIVAEGVDADRITLISFGEANPKCSEKTKSCWAENRRADFKIRP